jgi:hypothetical protein
MSREKGGFPRKTSYKVNLGKSRHQISMVNTRKEKRPRLGFWK